MKNVLYLLIRGIVRTHYKGVTMGTSEEWRPIQSLYDMQKPNRKSKSNTGKKVKTKEVMVNEVSNPSLF